MNGESTGPIINSRHNNDLPSPNKTPYFVVGFIILIVIVGGFLFFIVETKMPVEVEDDYYSIAEEEAVLPFDSTQMGEIKEHVKENIITEEEGTAEFFYKRALQKEKAKDFDGAVEYYTKTIELAKKYSSEMFNGLNGRGFIYAKTLKEYKLASADFTKIIKIEKSKTTPSSTRLEAGYTNRAYVKKMRGDKDGACNDLYDALFLGNEKSVDFIEKQIDKTCY